MVEAIEYSPYALKLAGAAKLRYAEKLTLINGQDPFLLGSSGVEKQPLPPIEATDLVSYLVLQTSFVTAKQFKAHKSMEAYNQFVSGWVKEVSAWSINGKSVITGRVRHSQRCNETPLSCWIICEQNGEICCAHCTCMAGLGEVCTHVASVLFYTETSTRLSGKITCTQEQCKWIIPSYQKNIPYCPIKDLDFTSAKGKKKKIDDLEITPPSNPSKRIRRPPIIDSPETTDINCFYHKLSECGTKPAILSITTPYAENYKPKSDLPEFPPPLTELYKKEYLQYNYITLLEACSEITIELTPEMVRAIEKSTKEQSHSKLWFTYRAGRVTASKMKSVCRTDCANPSQSLIKCICYPEAFKFSTKATSWGCKHEKTSRDLYRQKMIKFHNNFEVNDSGLVINPLWTHIGASPDGIVCCACCSKGVVEVKCSYCHRNESIYDSATVDKKFCLKKDSDGTLRLDHGHSYYYQVQTQIFVCGVEYCDFVLCTFPDNKEPEIFCERIQADRDLWTQCLTKCNDFFKICILPELLGHWYTRPLTSSSSTLPGPSNSKSSEDCDQYVTYCYCKEPEREGDEMIGCDNSNCTIEWFHTRCLKIKIVPKGKWYCPTCRKLPEFKSKGKSKEKML